MNSKKRRRRWECPNFEVLSRHMQRLIKPAKKQYIPRFKPDTSRIHVRTVTLETMSSGNTNDKTLESSVQCDVMPCRLVTSLTLLSNVVTPSTGSSGPGRVQPFYCCILKMQALRSSESLVTIYQ